MDQSSWHLLPPDLWPDLLVYLSRAEISKLGATCRAAYAHTALRRYSRLTLAGPVGGKSRWIARLDAQLAQLPLRTLHVRSVSLVAWHWPKKDMSALRDPDDPAVAPCLARAIEALASCTSVRKVYLRQLTIPLALVEVLARLPLLRKVDLHFCMFERTPAPDGQHITVEELNAHDMFWRSASEPELLLSGGALRILGTAQFDLPFGLDDALLHAGRETQLTALHVGSLQSDDDFARVPALLALCPALEKLSLYAALGAEVPSLSIPSGLCPALRDFHGVLPLALPVSLGRPVQKLEVRSDGELLDVPAALRALATGGVLPHLRCFRLREERFDDLLAVLGALAPFFAQLELLSIELYNPPSEAAVRAATAAHAAACTRLRSLRLARRSFERAAGLASENDDKDAVPADWERACARLWEASCPALERAAFSDIELHRVAPAEWTAGW